MENGDFFSRVEFEKLFTELEKNPSEISMCRKLGKHLLLKKGSQDRQNVKKACQLLSRLLYRQVSYYFRFSQKATKFQKKFKPKFEVH